MRELGIEVRIGHVVLSRIRRWEWRLGGRLGLYVVIDKFLARVQRDEDAEKAVGPGWRVMYATAPSCFGGGLLENSGLPGRAMGGTPTGGGLRRGALLLAAA